MFDEHNLDVTRTFPGNEITTARYSGCRRFDRQICAGRPKSNTSVRSVDLCTACRAEETRFRAVRISLRNIRSDKNTKAFTLARRRTLRAVTFAYRRRSANVKVSQCR